MKVILTEDVKSLGKKGDLVDVSDGYARNFILSKKKGLEATPANLNSLKLKKANDEKIAQEQLEAAQAFAADLKTKEVKLTIKKGEGGKAFGSITSKEIATAAEEQLSVTLDKKKIVLKDPIKTEGTYQVPIKLHPQVTGELKVSVTEE
ncbi:MAG: 50S ribosomal protein L9 [Lachnospiraceae bacterium]|jgi:large subunit ribosomal protein L9|nr:50S ribosomal protein L9 [Lachnospiraceae bacterium]MBR3736255.1 50S ribosomal protein L9 [Lachnospiraceae bacterium]MBR6155530.1 50S ribosomal protein L9 [Lachnospiraceae bacterium]MBR6849021.1 50S ribosomal protein L9 [Lachnospiraceae bacterium]